MAQIQLLINYLISIVYKHKHNACLNIPPSQKTWHSKLHDQSGKRFSP